MDEFIRAMADPVGYVEAHGGVSGFMARQLTPSSAPLPPARLTPAPMTPIPGMQHMYTPAPGTLSSPSPTTLSSAAGQVQGGRSRAGFVIAGVLVVGAATVAVLLVLNSNKKKDDPAAAGSNDVITMGSGSSSEITHPTPDAAPALAPDAAVVAAGSDMTVVHAGSGAGSAMHAGSGAGSAVTNEPVMVSIHVSSNPEAAEIFVNGVDTQKKTYATISVPRTKKPAQITLRLKGYDDFTVKDVDLDRAELTESATLVQKKVVPPPHGNGHGSGHGTGKGSGKLCETCLEKPD
jgi:hypothetical protein